ncbi:MAG: hypothetical protein EOP53_27055 [Sphingobacteriales bacterium]|nr:MAG: hypothetical protein EOP53_27055 [Sphingobacteriales bacterium]
MKSAIETDQTFKLIDGTFLPKDAKEVLTALITSKINFHSTRSFSSLVRTGVPDVESDLRIIILNETREEILSLLKHAEANGKKVTIQSNIEIKIEE